MPDPVTGAIGVGTAVSAVSADRASKRADKAAGKVLAFDMQKYNDWKEIYGPIEQNLSEYYQSLSPESFTAQGFQNIEAEFQKVNQSIEENLAQRGLDDSGIDIATDQNLQIQKALAKAKVRQEAPQEVRRQQQTFLQGGEQRRARAEQGISQSLQSATNRADVNADQSAEAFGQLLNLGLRQIPGVDAPTASTTSTASAATLRA